MKIYAIRDRAQDAFANPNYLASHGQAIRMFGDEVNRADEKNVLYQHPEDFDLYYLGEFDQATGAFEGTRPEQIAIGKDLAVRSNGNAR